MEPKPFETGDRVRCIDDILQGWKGRPTRPLTTLELNEKCVVSDCFYGFGNNFWVVTITGKAPVYKSKRFKKTSLSNEERMLIRKQELIEMTR